MSRRSRVLGPAGRRWTAEDTRSDGGRCPLRRDGSSGAAGDSRLKRKIAVSRTLVAKARLWRWSANPLRDPAPWHVLFSKQWRSFFFALLRGASKVNSPHLKTTMAIANQLLTCTEALEQRSGLCRGLRGNSN